MKSKKKKVIGIVVLAVVGVALIVGIVLTHSSEGRAESLRELMRDAVLHESGKISLFGLEVNPAYISSLVVCGALLLFAAIVRIFAIPRFRYVPGKFQMLVEKLVDFFSSMAKTNSPHRNGFLGAYIFGAGCYIFVGTMFELFGLQVVNTHGISMAMPAPLSDINAAISLGCLSYLVILSGGITSNGLRGLGKTLKDFSLPISMSFRLFGALLSGLLVTELVYYFITLSFVLPVVVAVLFTLIHALVQTYVLTTLTTVFYGEVTEKHEKKKKQRGKAAPKLAQNTEPAV